MILGVIAIFHLYWGFGGQTGIDVSLPQRENGLPIMPFPIVGAAVFGLGLIGVAVFALGSAGVVALPLLAIFLSVGILLWAALLLA